MGELRSLFDAAVAEFAARPFLDVGGAIMSYRDAQRNVDSMISVLQREGGENLQAVGVSSPSRALEVLAMIALSGVDRTAVPLAHDESPNSPRLARANASHVLSAGRGGATLTALTPGSATYDPAEIAYILSTSGSTGEPKHVPISHRSLAAYSATLSRWPTNHHDVFALVYPSHFDAYFEVLLAALRVGGTLAVSDPGEQLSVSDFCSAHRVSVWCSTPSVVRLTSRLGRLTKDVGQHVRLAVLGGEPFYRGDFDLIRGAWAGATVVNSYGPSECTVAVAEYWVAPDEEPQVSDDGQLSIGSALDGCELALHQHVSGRDELIVRGPQRFGGYLDPVEAGRSFLDDARRPLSAPRNERDWYRTGDAASVVGDRLFLYGRMDRRSAKVLGQRVDLHAVESAITTLPQITAAVVFVIEDRLVAVVESPVLRQVESAALRQLGLRRYATPGRTLVIPQFPRLASGKPDLAALRKMAAGVFS